MFEIGKDLLKPADGRKPFFSGYDPRGVSYLFDCSSCGSTIETSIIILRDMQSNIPKDMLDMLKEHFGIGYVGKTRDGGWPAPRNSQRTRTGGRVQVHDRMAG